MQPIKSNITTSSGKCLNPVTSKCVVWDGPDITCIDGTTICKGQTIETSVYTLATKLCEIYRVLNLEDINTCINSVNGNNSGTIGPNSSIKEVFLVLIEKICGINTRVEILENEDPVTLTAVVPLCLRSYTSPCFPNPITSFPNYDSVNNTLPIKDFAEASATLICCMQTDISALQNNVSNINQQIADLWSALNACSNSIPAKVLPTCTYNFTTNPDGKPVTVQEAYKWLEADYCELSSKIGTTSEITSAVNAQCPNLGQSDKLSSGGIMNNTSGWVDTPKTLADSLTNLWLTVCDTRAAVQQILDGCCFSLCSFLEFGYDLEFDSTNGNYFDVIFNSVTTNFTQYTDPRIPAGIPSPWPTLANPGAGNPLPAWINTSFPTASQTNIIITIDDGQGTVAVFDTGMTINDWIIESNATSNGYRIDFTAIPGYDKTSPDQTIAFNFSYLVDDGVTPKTCEIDQIDGLVYECCAPAIYPNNVEIYSEEGTDFYIKPYGVYQPTVATTGTATGAGAGNNTLEDLSATWSADQFNDPTGSFGQMVTLTHLSGDIEYRYVISTNPPSQIQVNADWDAVVAAGDTYSIQDIYYPYPFDNPDYPQCVKNIQSINIQIVPTGQDGYNAADPNTWAEVAYTGTELTIDDVFSGLNNNLGYLQANTDYALVLTSNYLCGSADYTLIPFVTPIAAIVSIESGSPGNYSNAFQSIAVDVKNIYSDGDLKQDEVATLQYPAKFPLYLPTGSNITSFQVIPLKAVWLSSIGTNAYCACGIDKDPWGTSGGVPVRNSVLGTYRGYEVSMWKKNTTNNTYSKLLDQSVPTPKQYLTNTIIDPNLTFPSNTPVPATIDIPSTYSSSQVPIVVRYDPEPFQVITGSLSQTVTCQGGSDNIRVSYAGGAGAAPISFNFTIEVEIFTWDSTANSNQGGYVSYSPAKKASHTFAISIPQIGGNYSWSASSVFPFVSWPCAYGDALRINIINNDTMHTNLKQYRELTYDIHIHPKSNSQYSCAGINRNLFALNDCTYLGCDVKDSPTGVIASFKSIITEDFDVTLAPNTNIEIYIH